MEEENVKPVLIVADEYGFLTAILPNGKKRKIIADVYGNPYYGVVKLAVEEAEEGE